MSVPETTVTPGQSMAADISKLVVRMVSAYTGRGPTQARTSIDRDLISVVLRDSLTHGEQSLVSDGRAELVRDTRRAFQSTMSRDLIDGVEAITGRKVTAFLSDNHINPDIAVECFVLDSHAPPGASDEGDPELS